MCDSPLERGVDAPWFAKDRLVQHLSTMTG
jgi:hypothetical protein